MNFNYNISPRLSTLFIFLIREGITPDQIMVGVIQLANETQDFYGINASVDCLRSLIGTMHPDTAAEGVTAFILSLAAENVTTLMLLDALAIACHECGLVDCEDIIRITHEKLLQAKIRRSC
ncbi:hypothetical protein Cylst_5145 [Cylindrospermum stagnale PCC 7417]|uniref:Uncharacterized protein n=1 Tax=Cylindrospermum stagnale PCC 7417 TaxID=56107 RepID=K9X413_9NOST|nr:hypothetical protein [Cylindrospermum stagnale]AFZ27188.1 hypothetical protein Cylst_5145 [Cylindrospermum stagnale PCC 7417]